MATNIYDEGTVVRLRLRLEEQEAVTLTCIPPDGAEQHLTPASPAEGVYEAELATDGQLGMWRYQWSTPAGPIGDWRQFGVCQVVP